MNPTRPGAADVGAAFERYLAWAATVEWADVSAAARRRAALVLADDVAAALSAADEPQLVAVRQRLPIASGGPASLLAPGRQRMAVMPAAMTNALAMGWNELDEGYRKAVCHAGLYVLPALLATAEAQEASTAELLRALLLGYETVTRIARTFRFPVMVIHPHALLSPVGAAAGVAFLRRLPLRELMSAICGAATMSMAGPYHHALHGILARNTWAAQAAASGLCAVEWAQCGIGGDGSSLYEVYVNALGATEVDIAPLEPHAVDGWGVESGYQKMNASCQYTHSAIEAVQGLLARDPALQGGQDIAAIEVQAHPLGYQLDDTNPATTLGAKFSMPHAVAATLVHGNGGVAAFDAASLHDPRVARLRELTRLVPFGEVRPWPEDRPSRVTVTRRDGRREEAVCWSARGGPDRPFSEQEVWTKVEALSKAHAPGLLRTMREIAQDAQAAQPTPALARLWGRCVDDFLLEGSARAPSGGSVQKG